MTVLDRHVFRSLAAAQTTLAEYASSFNDHRRSSALGWLTPAERFNGSPFTDRGFEHILALQHLQSWLAELMAAA